MSATSFVEVHKPSSNAYISAWAEITSCHGIIDFHETSHICLKFFWATLLLVCFGITTIQVTGLVRNYLVAPHYETKSFLEDKGSADFPNITVCNFNRVNQSAAREWNMGTKQLVYLYGSIAEGYDFGWSDLALVEQRSETEVVLDYKKAWVHWQNGKNIHRPECL